MNFGTVIGDVPSDSALAGNCGGKKFVANTASSITSDVLLVDKGHTIITGSANITITITPKMPAGATSQKITFTLPGGEFPVPDLAPKVGTYNWGYWRDRASSTETCIWCSKDVLRTAANTTYDHRLIAARKTIPLSDNLFGRSPGYDDKSRRSAHSMVARGSAYMSDGSSFGYYVDVESTGMTANGYFANEPDENPKSDGANSPRKLDFDPIYHSLGGDFVTNRSIWMKYTGAATSRQTGTEKNGTWLTPLHQIPWGQRAYIQGTTIPGDWDNGTGGFPDGPYINKGDEGSIYSAALADCLPYYNLSVTNNGMIPDANFFTPNRVIPSSMMLGSLSTGVVAMKPWQTLLFRPGPAGHPGLASPPDYLIADLFTMPVVEPYAISEPMASCGKINMNYQIVPFTYITRSTGIQAVLGSEQMLAIPNSQSLLYKLPGKASRKPSFRYPINIDETLKGFTQRFDSHDIFRSAAEICSLWLVPQTGNATFNSIGDNWWKDYALTGDNSRERPYADIYPRLTTKSNSYTVHYTVQSLQKRGAADPAIWEEGKDHISGELRGAASIERYLDPSDPMFSKPGNDFATQVAAGTNVSMDSFYKFRVLQEHLFLMSGQ